MAQEEVDAISFLRQRYGGAQGQESQPSSAVDWLRSKYAPAPTPEGPGLKDYAGQSASSFAKGALDTGRMLLDFPATMGSAGAAMLGLNEVAETAKTLSPHYWAARGLQALERMVPTNEKVDAQQGGAGKWVSETGMNALGSTLPFLGLGMIAKGAGATTRAATALTALTGASVNAVSGYEDAIRSGATPEQAFRAMLVNGGLGTLEAATPARILARIDGKLGGRLGKAITDAFIEGGTEAMTEAIQQLGQDAYASMSFDERREVTQGLSDAAGGGGFAGVLMSLLGSGMARGHQQEASKVGPKEGVQPEPSQAAQEGPAQAPAMAEGTLSKPVETTDQRVQEAMQRISQKAGVPVSVVEDQTGYEWEAERAKMAGSQLVLFRVGDGKATEGAPTGFSKGGVTYLNADLPEGSRRKAVLYHELTHRLAGEDQGSWKTLHADLQANAPELLSKIGERYKASFGEDLTPEADAEESVAAFAEELPGFIRAWEENPGQFKETKRGFVRRIIDWITEKLGGTSSVKKELLALRDSIAETDLEKTADPALLRDVSRSFAAGLAELEKSKPVEPIEVRSTEAGQVEPESMPPVAQQPVASRSPRAVGPSGPEAVKNPELYDEQGRPVVGSWSRGPQAIERSKPLTTKGEIDVEIPEDEPAYVPTKPNELTRRSKEELEADLEKALAIERERVKLVFEGRGKLWQERFIELRQSARRPSSPAQEAAARQVRAVEAQLRPRALEVLQGGHEAGRNVEALMGALRYKELEAEASRLERRSGNREASRAAGERAQEAARRVGTEERFAVSRTKDKLGFYSQLESSLDEKMPNKANVAQVRAIAKQGSKAEEYEWSGLEDWLKGKSTVTKAEVLEFLRENNVQVSEVDSESDKFSQYQTPGGKNYRELLLTLPYFDTPEMKRLRAKVDALEEEERSIKAAASKPIFEKYRAEIEEADRQAKNLDLPTNARAKFREVRDDLEYARDNEAVEAGQKAFEHLREGLWAARREYQDVRDSAVGKRFEGGHFDTPNVLAHVRFNERTTADGKRVLFLEEVQSDWHQKGRERGYQGTMPDGWRVLPHPEGEKFGNHFKVLDAQGSPMGYGKTEQGAIDNALAESGMGHGQVPNAPFKSTWHDLAMKRMVRYAAEHGFDELAWTTGAMQIDRYNESMRQNVDKIVAEPRESTPTKPWGLMSDEERSLHERKNYPSNTGPTVYIRASKNGSERFGAEVPLEGTTRLHGHEVSLEDVVGKEIAAKIRAGETTFEGEGLAIGGKGMQTFYDQMLTASANKIGKKFGARVGRVEVGIGRPTSDGEISVPSLPITSELRASVMDEGQPRFAVAPQGRFDIPDESRSDKFLRKIQDRYIRLKRIQERIAKRQPVSEDANAEQKVRLFPSRLRDRYEKVEKFSNSVVEHLVKSGISVEDAGMFVYALGAEQRNATMAKRYPRKFGNVANPGSGITTAEAQKILRESYAKNKAGYEWIRDQVAAANKAKLDLAQQSGFLNDEARKKWEEDFGQYHAPLYTWEKDSEDAFTGYGSKSFNNAERITKTAKGRRSIADNPLVNLIDSMAKWSLRAESNRVGRSLGKLVEEAPDASLWEPIDSMSKAKPEDQVFTYWQDGQKRMVILHDAKLARAMKAIGVEPAGELLRLAQGIRTTYSKLHTSWNPEFIGPNLLKDTLAAAATLNLEQGPAFTAKALNPVRIKDSLMAIMADQHGREHKLSKDVVEWKERGGMTGWNLQPETLRKRFDQLEKQVDLAKKDTTGKHVVLAWLKGKKIVEDFSSAAENAVRFSVYRAFIEAGASPDEAARQSKTITIDFDSRGEISTPFNVMYLFFNANVQGTARIFQALKKAPPRRTAALAASMVSFGYLVSFLNRLMSDDDENGVNRWDTISQNDKAHNLSLMYGDRRVMLPQPWGWSLFTYMGQQAEQLQNGRYKSNEAVKDLLTQSAESFSPIQGSTPTQVVAPWFADPFIQVQENKDFAGRSIMPREDPFKRYQTPDSYRYFPDVNPSLKTAADALNRWTGGDQVEAGVLDISPETMEHLLGESAGGFGRAAMRVANLMDKGLRGEGIRPSEIPAVRRFYQEAPSWFTYSLFSDNLTEVEKQEEYRSQGMQFDAAVIGQGRATRNQIEKLNRAMKAVPEGPVRKRLEDRKLEIEQRFNKFMESRNK